MAITKDEIKNIDTQDMWGLVKAFPEHWQEIVAATADLELTIDESKIENICFAGMGGSAIGADLTRAYSLTTCPVPVYVNRHYEIPEWVGENTLFVTCSFSGNTEETLSALENALKKGAQVIAVTSGGQLLVTAEKEDFDYIRIPGGMPPRAALAYSFVPLFRIFQKLGFLGEGDEALEETYKLLREGVDDFSDLNGNEALAIAEELSETLPIIYSDAGMMEPVNLRWRGQFEENAKMLAYGNVLPEMNHNEIVGWEQIAHLTGRLSVILLKDTKDHPKVQRRMEIVEELVIDQALSVIEIETYGVSRLARLFSLIQLGDWISIYLALVNNVDPTPIAKIDLLKSKLAEV
ncbi:MAG: bifunctional phosphoglucose/phosphomannose isomerase [Balneolaceae bacterium]|nr:bifunctional phosphoglucose/phosphomannose isomerase [Balneolaceae bacterium]